MTAIYGNYSGFWDDLTKDNEQKFLPTLSSLLVKEKLIKKSSVLEDRLALTRFKQLTFKELGDCRELIKELRKKIEEFTDFKSLADQELYRLNGEKSLNVLTGIDALLVRERIFRKGSFEKLLRFAGDEQILTIIKDDNELEELHKEFFNKNIFKIESASKRLDEFKLSLIKDVLENEDGLPIANQNAFEQLEKLLINKKSVAHFKTKTMAQLIDRQRKIDTLKLVIKKVLATVTLLFITGIFIALCLPNPAFILAFGALLSTIGVWILTEKSNDIFESIEFKINSR